MKLNNLFSFFSILKTPGFLPVMKDWKGMLRFHFLFSAVETGLLEALATPCTRNDLIGKLRVKNTEILDALLNVGISIKELKLKDGHYSIKGKRSLALLGDKGDMIAAIIQANVTYYNRSYRNAAKRLKGAPLGDDLKYAGDIVARFSKLTDPVVKCFLSSVISGKGGLNVLDIGCGSGSLLRTIQTLDKRSHGIGLEKDDRAAGQAIGNLKKWGLESRFDIIKGGISDLPPDQTAFDLISLINVVYYFPVDQRGALFKTLRSRLSSRGNLVIVMNMEGKNSDAAAANLNMANASLEGVTPLPDPEELAAQLNESGFSNVHVSDLLPGSSFVGMCAGQD